MNLTTCFDAAYPPPYVPVGAGAALGYLKCPAAEHAWTPREWQPFARIIQFPAWVCAVEGQVQGDPVRSARAAVVEAAALGWHVRDRKRALIGDMETAEDPEWWARFALTVEQEGMEPVCYGSDATIGTNQAARLWVAKWDGSPVLEPGWDAKQYQQGVSLDWSVVSEALAALGGHGARRQP